MDTRQKRIAAIVKKEEETKREIDKQIENSKMKRTIYEENNDIKDIDKILTPGELKEYEKFNIKNEILIHDQNDFLKTRNRINFNHNNFDEKYKINKKCEKIKQNLNKFKNSKDLPCKAIGYIKNIDEFVQMFNIFGKNISDIIKKNFQNITNYREIMGDGNCFFRAIMFKYFELIIFHKKDDLFRDLIYEIEEMFSADIMQQYLKINEKIELKKELIINILILLYNILNKEKDQKNCYLYFFLAINTCNKFDLSLILYLRYILYKYIKSNEEKMFSKNWPVKIGNLLPEKFEVNGNFLFNKFYEEYLLTMYTFAEKLVIYIIPFIFGVPLNIFFYESNEENKIQKFEYNLENYDFKEQINLIYKANHYELTYPEEEIKKFKQFYAKYIKEENVIKRICSDCKNQIELYNYTELCDNCLFKFLNEEVLKIIQKAKTINLNYFILEFKMKSNKKYQFENLLNIIINSSIPNKPIDKDSFIKQIRKQFCILDMVNIIEIPITLPCGCSFHDMNCLRNYFKDDYLNQNLLCQFCKYNYNFDEIFSIFQKLCEKMCCICGNIYENNLLNIIKYSYPYDENKKIHHYICAQCKPKRKYMKFKCKCCKINHIYYR